MEEKEKKELKGIVTDIIFEELEKGNLTEDENYNIIYTEDFLNSIIMELLLNGFTTKEVMYMRQAFINFEMEQDITVYDTVEFETKGGGKDWYEINERIETVVLTTKKVSWKINCQLIDYSCGCQLIVDNQWGGIRWIRDLNLK